MGRGGGGGAREHGVRAAGVRRVGRWEQILDQETGGFCDRQTGDIREQS